jgi:hypothetical protein
VRQDRRSPAFEIGERRVVRADAARELMMRLGPG